MAGLGALKKLFQEAKRGSSIKDELGAFGKYFREIPNEEYFRVLKSPSTTVGEASDKYRVVPRLTTDLSGRRTVELTPREGLKEDEHPPKALVRSIGDYLKGEEFLTDPKDVEALRALGTDNPFYEIDTTYTKVGSGQAPRLYSYFYDTLSGIEGLPNISPQLTSFNQRRKGMNSADTIKRNPRILDLIIPGQQQVKGLGMSPLQYLEELGPYEKLGTHLGSSADHMMEAISRLSNSGPWSGGEGFLHEAIDKLTPDMGIPEYRKLLADYGYILGPQAGIGSRALRKLNIMNSILEGTEGQIPSGVRKNLGYQKGGLVKVHECTCSKNTHE